MNILLSFLILFIIPACLGIDEALSATLYCKKWHQTQPNPKLILHGLPPCRPSISLASKSGRFPSSFGDFIQDASCNPSNPIQCWILHRGAKACFRSKSRFNGAGQQCCYSEQGKLLVGYPGGGTLDVAHADDVFSHFKIDVYPFFLCCELSDNCNLYYEKRPSDDGSRWNSK